MSSLNVTTTQEKSYDHSSGIGIEEQADVG